MPNTDLSRLADEYLDLLFDAEPVRASLLGLPRPHDRLGDPSDAADQRRRAALLDLAARAEAIDPAALTGQDALTREVLLQQTGAAVDHLDARLADFTVSDGLSAPALTPMISLPMLGLGTEEAAEGYLARLTALGEYLDAVTERQRAGLAAGFVPPAFLINGGIAYVDRYLADPDGDPFRIDSKSGLAGFAERRDTIITGVVRPAYARYREFLADELLPHGTGEDKAGLCWRPGGDEKYAGLIRAHTTTARTAQELHDTGLRLIDELAAEYRELGRRVFDTEDLGEIFDRLRTDPALRWHDGEEMLEAARAAIRKAEAAAPQWFATVPTQACEVRPVPEAEADGGTVAYYVEPALDGSRPGIYYANVFQAHERFRHTGESIAFHEAVPGHHFQLTTALGLTELPLLRRIADVNAYIEGWGLYSERLADEMGLYSSDVTRFGLLTQDSMRAGRLVVDTGLHALGWSRQRAVDFLRDHTPMAPLEIEAEIDRYAAVPGQALSYMVGRLEIQRLRREAEAELGDRFDIRGFHDVVLGNGNLPLSVLEAVVREWVQTR